MKKRILTFLGLLVASVGIMSFAQSSPVYAAGETYRWMDETAIEASGGHYSQLRGNSGTGRPLTLQRQSTGVYVNASTEGGEGEFSKCSLTFRLTVGSDNVTGTLTITDSTNDCPAMSGFDKNVKISNPNSGPPMDGHEVDYRTVNCSQYYEGGNNVDRCEAIKKCITVNNNGTLDCLRSWNTCLINHTVNGSMVASDRQKCITLISAGDLNGANTARAAAQGSGNDKTNCVIPGLGWIICPVINTLASLTDGAYYIVAAFLKVQPILTTGNTAGLYNAWQVMRNIANVAFVIVFLIVIFSQVTSAGISNYGIKRLLPRLIVAAILVNVSYWLCALAVDISNITGSSLKSLFDGIAGLITIPSVGADSTGVGFAGIAGGILAWTGVGLAVYVALGALIPILLSSLVVIAGVFVTLLVRQALIILLIAVSPLAFVAYLLPNTEGMFTQWRRLFWTLLVMYPLIALLFGACALASKIVSAGS